MKQQSNIRYLFLRRQRQRVGGPLLALVLALWGGLLSPAGGQTTNKWMDDEIVAALQRPNGGGITAFIRLFDRRSEHREQAIQSLLKLLNEARSDPSIKCCAAYYLGAMHAVEATESLATNITLSVQAGGSLYIMESPFWYRPAEHALGEIGVPAIPALLRNLVESQDANTRDASLRVLVGIDGDKDVVQLRLQKALKAGKGSERQARLQAALKALADPAVQR